MTGKDDILVRRETYRGWQAWRIERGPLALVLVPQVGGRLMGVQWHGQEIAFANPDLLGRVEEVTAVADVHEAKRRAGFLLWGGEKTWLAPQSRWTEDVPFLDLDSGAYDLRIDEEGGTATMTSPVCRETGVQIKRVLGVGEQPGSWRLHHTICNRSDGPVTWAPWGVAMMLRPATIYLPTRAGSAFPQGLRTFANEGVSTEVRDRVVSFIDGFAVISCHEPVRFKYGVDAEVGTALAVLEAGPSGLVGLRKTVPAGHDQPYANGCVIEVFNAPNYAYFEFEVHAPVTTLAPGDSVTLAESVAVFDLDRRPTSGASIRHCLGL